MIYVAKMLKDKVDWITLQKVIVTASENYIFRVKNAK